MKLSTPFELNKSQAIELVKSKPSPNATAKWQAFDIFVTGLAERVNGITKSSITIGLILEADGSKLADYHKNTINSALDELNPETKRCVIKKANSIRALISMAYKRAADKADKVRETM